jgi:outer membrane protein
MRNRQVWLAAGAVALTMAAATMAAGTAAAESLEDAIALAYQSNPTLLAARADLRAADERYVEARAALGPTLGVSSQESFVDAKVDQQSFFGNFTSHDRVDNNTSQLTVSQLIYAGGQLNAALSAAAADISAGRANLRQRETAVLGQVISAYADVYLARQLLAIARQNTDILQRQLSDTDARFAAHEVTRTDRAQARARYIAAQVKLDQGGAEAADAAAHYLAVVGQSPGTLEAPPDIAGLPATVDAAFDVAERANPSLQVARYTELSSRANVRRARTADGLRIEFIGSLAREPVASYLGDLYDRSIIASFRVTKTLFDSGLHRARVREAQAIDERDDLRAADIGRQVIQAVAEGWNDLGSKRRILIALRDQLAEERTAFEGARVEERMGLRTTIEVLNAEEELQSTKVALAQQYHDEYLQRVSLLAAIGLLQADLINPGLEPYRPEQAFNKAVGALSAPWEPLVRRIDALGSPGIGRVTPGRDPLAGARPAVSNGNPATPAWKDAEAELAAPVS